MLNQESNQEEQTLFNQFAPFYDHDYRNYDEDIEAIVDLATAYGLEQGLPILELGCGTGRVLQPLVEAGCTVVGVDISPDLLAVAQKKLAGMPDAKFSLIEDDIRSFNLPQKKFGRFGFAFCTSNTFLHLTTSDDQIKMLTTVRKHLRQGGYLLIDVFNPDIPRLLQIDGVYELADQWADERTGATVLKWVVRRLDLAEQLQDTLFIYEEIFPDGTSKKTPCPFLMRFLWRSEAELMMKLAGLSVEAIWGDFEGGEYHSGSEHLILLVKK
ncbi:MAG: class I SAM-dependent methyltransferase [Chloroflexota bacterium]